MEELIKELNLPYEGEMKGDEYVVNIPDSDAYSEVFNIVSLNDDVEAEDDSTANDAEARFKFFTDDFEIKLDADFMNDIYRLTIGRR